MSLAHTTAFLRAETEYRFAGSRRMDQVGKTRRSLRHRRGSSTGRSRQAPQPTVDRTSWSPSSA